MQDGIQWVLQIVSDGITLIPVHIIERPPRKQKFDVFGRMPSIVIVDTSSMSMCWEGWNIFA